MNYVIALMLTLFVAACGSNTTKTEAPVAEAKAAPVAPAPDPNLTQAEAEERASTAANVKYELNIDLTATDDTFSASEKIEFDVKTVKNIFLNFRDGGKIKEFTINGQKFSPEYANHRILIPSLKLKAGTNTVEIQYQQKYSHNGRGLHTFTDPEDKRVYLYTQFEAFDAHQMFPSFDQPDMKATMTMTVTAPKNWEVITTTRETAKKAAGQSMKWTFPETPRISTYLFSLHAGPYAKWEAKAGNIPLRLFARQSLKKFVVTKDWFVPTQQGLKFFGNYFAFPYPFKKYDQIVVPEFNAGAMENVAAVTFTERFIRRSASTYKERESLASVILHEMAHMWFGDLVTMQWWNGLWLNESFATYMAALSQSEATEFKNAWQTFYGRKLWSYILDQQVVTHPIDSNIADTNSAFANFDAITYGKGASAMKQLAYYIGPDKFRDGVRYYFKTHAYKNTRLQDFMGALEHSSKQDLSTWSKTWLELAGLDTVQADFLCEKGKITSFALDLKGPNGGTSPRAHRTNITLYTEKAGSITPFKSENVIYQGSRTDVPQLVGQECPAMVYPNATDQDYVKVSLDKRTLDFVKVDMAKVKDNFTRSMFWPNLYSMVRDMMLTPQEYLVIVKKNLPGETDLTIGDSMVNTLGSVINYLPQSGAVEKKERMAQIADLESVIWTKLADPKTSTDWKKLLIRSYNWVGESETSRDNMVGLLSDKLKVPGVTLDLDQRWDMIIHLSQQGDQRVQALLEKQKKADTSDRGVENAMAAEAAQPSLAVKDSWIKKMLDGKDLSYTQKRTVLWRMLPRTQDNLRESLSDRYYQMIPDLVGTRELLFSSLVAEALMPTTCTQASTARLGKFVEETGSKLPPPVLKEMRVGHQEDGRCVSIRAFASRPKSR